MHGMLKVALLAVLVPLLALLCSILLNLVDGGDES